MTSEMFVIALSHSFIKAGFMMSFFILFSIFSFIRFIVKSSDAA